MEVLKGEHIYLRVIEPTDLDFLESIENDKANWEVSGTQKPFTQKELVEYLKNAHLDIYEAKQLRFVITSVLDKKPVGFIDLFDFDTQHKRAGVGIIIIPSEQNKGHAKAALKILIKYCFSILHLRQLYANILEDNTVSIQLFTQQGFKEVGVKKDWIFYKNKFKNEILYQLINS